MDGIHLEKFIANTSVPEYRTFTDDPVLQLEETHETNIFSLFTVFHSRETWSTEDGCPAISDQWIDVIQSPPDAGSDYGTTYGRAILVLDLCDSEVGGRMNQNVTKKILEIITRATECCGTCRGYGYNSKQVMKTKFANPTWNVQLEETRHSHGPGWWWWWSYKCTKAVKHHNLMTGLIIPCQWWWRKAAQNYLKSWMWTLT